MRHQALHFDIAHIENIGGVGDMAGKVGAEHIVFGSHAPLLYMESACLKMKEADLADDQRRLIASGNAQAMLAR